MSEISASWLAVNMVSAMLLPPLNLVLLALTGLWLRNRAPRFGIFLVLTSLLLLLVFSTGAGSRLLVAPLEKRAQPLVTAPVNAQAIVVLGAGRIGNAPEYGGQDVPGLEALARLRYGAHLQRTTGLPLLVSGGRPDGAKESEAAIMARVLREDFSVPVKWLETRSENTAQNADYSARMLRQERIQRVVLVTDAIHMLRAQAVFSRYGVDVVPAPTTFTARAPLAAIDFVPNARALARTHYAMHEWVGLLWYRIRHGS
jgi:uncharacterized SAM-binding protein YcdF (DUF218 family)